MLSGRWFAGFAAGVVVAMLLVDVPGWGQSFNITPGGFTSSNVCANSSFPAGSCQVLTNGSPSLPKVITGGILRLNSANLNQHASAWFSTPQPLSTGFTTSFQFRVSNTGACVGCGFPADGLAIVIQGDPSKTGAIGYTGNGENVSYGNNDVSTASGPGHAILNSLAIELDTHQNTDYSDPDGNHIAVQSCGPNTSTGLTPNSADHNYQCPNGQLAKLALKSLPAGVNLADGNLHTITVNYTAPGNITTGVPCTSNLCVYLDSNLLLQTNFDITQILHLTSTPSNSSTPATGAYIGFTSATGSLVQNNDIVSWSFSQLPLAPITITQPLQTTATQFNYTSALNSAVDYSQSGLPSASFNAVFMQGTSQAITDQQFTNLVQNTPFQGSTCLRQDLGSGTFSCVVTTDLCTNSSSSTPSGANCPNTGTSALIGTSNTFNIDPSQKPLAGVAYIMGKDTALGCAASSDNTCKGLQNIFQSVSGDSTALVGRTKDFNSLLLPVQNAVQPSTIASTSPSLNQGWTNGNVSITLTSTESVPTGNQGPPSPLPTISSISYTISGANASTPITGTINGPSGSVTIPGTVEGTTTVTYQALDSSNTPEAIITNSNNNTLVSTSLPTLAIKVDLTPPTFVCTSPAAAWQGTDVTVPCTESDNANGSGPATPNFTVSTAVPNGTETSTAFTNSSSVADIAGNSASVPAYGPFLVDKKAPVITGPTLNGSAAFGQPATASYSCADGGSGVTLCGPAGTQSTSATSNTGTLTGALDTTSAGSHTFTVNAKDAVGNQSTPGVLNYTVQQALPTITWAAPAAITYGTMLGATQLNAIGNVPGTFTYNPAVGSIPLAGSQILSATFTPTDTANYATTTATVTLVVNKAMTATMISAASPSPALPGQGVAISVKVIGSTNVATPGGTVTVNANTGETCTAAVSAGGCSLTFSSTGQHIVTAFYSGDGSFSSSSTTSSVVVTVGDFSITATPTSQTIPSGHQAVYTITVIPIGGLTGTVTLTCSGGPPNSICSVSPSADNLQGVPTSSTVTLSPNKNVTHVTSQVIFTATYGNGALAHSVSVTLTVK